MSWADSSVMPPVREFSFLDPCGFCGRWPTTRNDHGQACVFTDLQTGERRIVCDVCRDLAHRTGAVEQPADG